MGETTLLVALIVGDNVGRAMNSLNSHVAETGISVGVIRMNYAFLLLLHFTSPRNGGSCIMGGFSGGGAGWK